MEFFSFFKHPQLIEAFEPGCCNDGSHVKGEVSECYFPCKGVLVEETNNRAAVVHDNGKTNVLVSYRLRKRSEKVREAITEAKKEQVKFTHMYNVSTRLKEGQKIAYPGLVYPPHIVEKRRRALEAARMASEFKGLSPGLENLSDSLTLSSFKSPCNPRTSALATTPVKQKSMEDPEWMMLDSVPVEDDYVVLSQNTVFEGAIR